MDYIYGKLSGVANVSELIDEVDELREEVGALDHKVDGYDELILNLQVGKQDKLTAGENITIGLDETGNLVISSSQYNIGEGLVLDEETNTVNIEEFTNNDENTPIPDDNITRVVTNHTYIENCKYGVEEITYYDPIEELPTGEETGDYIFKLNNEYNEVNIYDRLNPLMFAFRNAGYRGRMYPLYYKDVNIIVDDLMALSSNDSINEVQQDTQEDVNPNSVCTILLCNDIRTYFDLTFPQLDKEYWYVIGQYNESTGYFDFINKWYEIRYNNGGEQEFNPKNVSNDGNTRGGGSLEPLFPIYNTPDVMIEITSQEDTPTFIYEEAYINPENVTGVTPLIKGLFKDICLINEPKIRREEITVKQKMDNLKDWTYEIKAEEVLGNETQLLPEINWSRLIQITGYDLNTAIYEDTSGSAPVALIVDTCGEQDINGNWYSYVRLYDVASQTTYEIVDTNIQLGSASGVQNVIANRWFTLNPSTGVITYLVDEDNKPIAPNITLYKNYILSNEYYNFEDIFKILVVTTTKTTPQKLSKYIDSLAYTTVLPLEDNNSGRLIMVLVDEEYIEEIDKYNGYLYIGVEGLEEQEGEKQSQVVINPSTPNIDYTG